MKNSLGVSGLLATQNIPEDDVWWNALAYLSQGESHLLRLQLTKSIQEFLLALLFLNGVSYSMNM